MDALANLLHLLLTFLVAVATLIVNFLISFLNLILQFIRGVAGSAQ